MASNRANHLRKTQAIRLQYCVNRNDVGGSHRDQPLPIRQINNTPVDVYFNTKNIKMFKTFLKSYWPL